jgi:hypothetical protein
VTSPFLDLVLPHDRLRFGACGARVRRCVRRIWRNGCCGGGLRRVAFDMNRCQAQPDLRRLKYETALRFGAGAQGWCRSVGCGSHPPSPALPAEGREASIG